MRRRVLNEMLVLLYRTRQESSPKPLKFDIPCGNNLAFDVRPDHRIKLRYDAGAIKDLRSWYNGRSRTQRDWQLGTSGGTQNDRPITYHININAFSDLEGLYFGDTDSLSKALETGLQQLAFGLCSTRAGTRRITAYRWRAYHYQLTRNFCIFEVDIYQAVNIRAKIRESEFGGFLDDVNQALAQAAAGWATVKANIRRAGRYESEDVIVRETNGIATFYLKLGLADITVQSSWTQTLNMEDCHRERRDAAGELEDPEYDEKPERPGKPDAPLDLGELDPAEDGVDDSEDNR